MRRHIEDEMSLEEFSEAMRRASRARLWGAARMALIFGAGILLGLAAGRP